mmetsp:Transcript_35476/g.52834  ORF Transcript_35476/g.52834 Transcript_35476/m.52834 type:complete len:245 (+) Transcript_35476:94-828(+)
MDAICPAAKLAHLTAFVPKVLDLWLEPLCEEALTGIWSNALWAGNSLEWSMSTESALFVDPVREATQLSICAARIPEVGSVRLVGEGALVQVGRTTSCNGATNNGRARQRGRRSFPTETALDVDAIGPAAQVTKSTVHIPVVGHQGFVRKLAARGWTRNLRVIASTTEAAKGVLAISQASQSTIGAGLVPEVARKGGWKIEVTSHGCGVGVVVFPKDALLHSKDCKNCNHFRGLHLWISGWDKK